LTFVLLLEPVRDVLLASREESRDVEVEVVEEADEFWLLF